MSDKVEVTLTRRAHAIVDEEITFTVDSDKMDALMAEGATADEAVDELKENGQWELVDRSAEVKEVVQVHEYAYDVDYEPNTENTATPMSNPKP